ncbi:hypothetical protein E2C01_037179 [Portunus trituberculatus]|uniref:Uncharacterized protein n=1 Tax=Portunus trituberculatus TaxID=210409 RepID=A0A5B7F7G0_PORTR|nr:hypothetical protein [Portunus trituberculatus]
MQQTSPRGQETTPLASPWPPPPTCARPVLQDGQVYGPTRHRSHRHMPHSHATHNSSKSIIMYQCVARKDFYLAQLGSNEHAAGHGSGTARNGGGSSRRSGRGAAGVRWPSYLWWALGG